MASVSKEEFKKRVRDTFRDTLKTSGQLRHILAQERTHKGQPPLRISMNSVATFMRKSMNSHEDRSSSHSTYNPFMTKGSTGPSRESSRYDLKPELEAHVNILQSKSTFNNRNEGLP